MCQAIYLTLIFCWILVATYGRQGDAERLAETEICNQKMQVIKKDKKEMRAAEDAAILEEGQRLQDKADLKRCLYTKKRRQGNKECHDAVLEQIKEKERASKPNVEYDEYQRQLAKQLAQLVAHKELTEAQARKLHQKNLLQQIDYNQLLKKRAIEEELAQREKAKIAADEYQKDIIRIMSRAYFCEEIHPFTKTVMKELKMKEKCPCSKPDYCAGPVLDPKEAPAAANTTPGPSTSK